MTHARYSASDKERFELCIAMLKGYYDALEARLAGTVGLFVVIIGWLITSQGARTAMAAYLGPVVLLDIFLISCLALVASGRFV